MIISLQAPSTPCLPFFLKYCGTCLVKPDPCESNSVSSLHQCPHCQYCWEHQTSEPTTWALISWPLSQNWLSTTALQHSYTSLVNLLGNFLSNYFMSSPLLITPLSIPLNSWLKTLLHIGEKTATGKKFSHGITNQFRNLATGTLLFSVLSPDEVSLLL